MKKKLIFFAVLLTQIFLISACSKNDTAKQGDEGGVKTVSMLGWYDEENMKKTIEATEEKLNGKYKIEYSFVSLQQYNNVLSTQLASGEGPDIILDGASFPARIQSENLMDISDKSLVDNFSESGLALATSKEGKVYGIPSYGWFSGVWYNKDIFEKYNLEAPETFDEFLEVCKKLSDAKVKPLGLGLSDGDTGVHSLVGYLENVFYHNEGPGTEFDEKFAYGEETLSNNWDKDVDKWMQLITDGYINETMLGISGDQNLNAFINGEVAMMNGGPWNYNNLKEAGLNFGMISHLGNDSENKWLVGGPAANMGINKNTKKVDESLEVLEALASEEVQMAFLESNPGSFSYHEAVSQELPEEYDLIADILEKGNVGCSWDRWGVNMPAETFLSEFKKQIQNLVSGTSNTKDFLEAMDNKAEELRYK